ncbi:Transcription factor, fungi, partial [Metarhizium hybridum]
MSTDPPIRRIPPQHVHAQTAQMSSFQFAPQQFPQRETQKNYVFVDEHNRHKRLKVMRACEGCRKRKIKCDAATTNTWPCSACIRLKLHCVRPNGYEGSDTTTTYDTILDPSAQFQQMSLPGQAGHDSSKPIPDVYQGSFTDRDQSAFQQVSFDTAPGQHNLHYTTVPAATVLDHVYGGPDAFPTPPMHQGPRPESSPEAQSVDSYQQQDFADLLGGLRLNEIGTAPYLRNKASFRQEEQPAVEDDDDYGSILPAVTAIPGHKIRIPPALMPDESTALHHFDLYFRHVHPYVPVLDKAAFYQQWNTGRESISPLILEAIFAIGGRLAEEPAMGQQWLALASRHADSFMDVPRLSTLQALLMMLKAREAAPKRGYFYRSWMLVVQCVQMGKDLGLDEHFEDHQAGISCGFTAAECRLRTRIWQTIFVCENMVGAPQGRHDLTVNHESVDFNPPRPIPGGDESEYHVSRNFTYLARILRNIRKMSIAYAKLRRTKDWAVNPEFQQLEQMISAYLPALPGDMTINFPPDSSPPYLPSSFLGNLHSYYYLLQILYHRPVLSFLDPTANEAQWKHHMMISYNSAKALCRLQEATLKQYGLVDLQSMQRGFSFALYAGLSCIVIHLVAIVSPDPDLNSDAREYFERHMRLMETVMEAWPMPDLQKQVDAIREAFSADIGRPFVLKPSFPYGSPHPSNQSSSPQGTMAYHVPAHRTGSMDHQLDPSNQHVSYINRPITPPISVGAMDSRSDSPAVQSLVMMPQDGPVPDMQQTLGLANNPPTWNPARIFEHWNTSFGTPSQPGTVLGSASQATSLNVVTAGVPDQTTIADQASNQSLSPGTQQMTHQQYSTTTSMPNFITPAMWQESVASVYEGGLKRGWDYDGGMVLMKRR